MSTHLQTLGSFAARPDGRRVLTLDNLKLWMRDGRWQPTRFATWRALPAGLLLAAFIALTTWGVAISLRPGAGSYAVTTDPAQTDVKLYTAIVDRMAGGEGYYQAVVAEQRQRNYPLRPTTTVRLPTVATIEATIGLDAAALLLAALTVLAWALLVRRLAASLASPVMLVAASSLAALGLMPGLFASSAIWHEPWAMAFVAMSLACRTRERWLASVLLGLAAVSIRELALPYLCVMAASALLEGSRREAAAWCLAILAFAGLMTAHSLTLSGLLLPGDAVSPGWLRASGWSFILSMLGNFTVLALLPIPAVSVIVSLSLLGWAAWPGAFGLRGALLMGGYCCAFMIVGRMENIYWGMIWGPLLPIGLVFAAPALRDLGRAALGRGAASTVPA